MTQYSKRVVIIHWLTLAVLVAAWFLGDSLADSTDESKATLAGYLLHMSAGGGVLLLTLARLFFRRKDGTPPLLDDKPVMQTVAKAVHHSLYTLLVLIPITGVATIITSSAGKALLAGNASLLPKEHDFEKVFVHEIHALLVNVLIALVVLHVIGALKHQFIMKDGLMDRMSLRKKG